MMNGTLTKALIASVPVSAWLVYSVALFMKRRKARELFEVLGVGCLLVVVLTHVAEALQLFPVMRFGEPDSIGHYSDLTSAVGGITLLALGGWARIRTKIA